MGYFAILDGNVAKAIERCLHLDPVASAIVSRNMGAVDKVNVLRTLVNLSAPSTDKARLDEVLKRAKRAAEERNIIAHNTFGESPASDGVVFFTVDAQKELRFNKLDWSVEVFINKIDELRILGDDLNSGASEGAFEFIHLVLRNAETSQKRNVSIDEIIEAVQRTR